LACSMVFGLVFGALSTILSVLAGETLFISAFMGLSLFIQLLCSVFIGTLIPLGMKRIGVDPTVASVSLFLAASNITAVLITFGAAYRVFQG
jgi:magnesium transporter